MARKRPRQPEQPPAPVPVAPWGKREWALSAALAVLTFAAYGPSLGGGLLWGDTDDLVSQAEQLTFSGLARAWTDPFYRQQFYPVTHTFFWLGAHLWGDAPAPYRALVLLLHVVSAVLLAMVLRKLAVRGAFAAAALFALHPLNMGTAAWISKLTNTLSAALALGALLCLLEVLPQDPSKPPGGIRSRRDWGYFGAGFALFTLAMLSKTAVAPLPVILLLIAWWKRGRIEPESFWLAAPLLVVSVGLGLITSKLEGALYPIDTAEFAWSPMDHVLIAGRALGFYLEKLAAPLQLSFVYPRWTLSASDPKQLAAVAIAVALPVALYALRARLGRGPVAAVLMAYALLFPALGFFKVWYMRFSFVADHWAYWASMALLPLAVAAVAQGLERAPEKLRQPVGVAVALAALALAGFATWKRAPAFASEERAWTDALRVAPHSELAETNLAWEWVKQDRFQDALELFERGLKDHPDSPQMLLDRGFLLMRSGRYDEAVASVGRALEEPTIDTPTRTKAEQVFKTARALRDAPPEERDLWIQKADEYVQAKHRKR